MKCNHPPPWKSCRNHEHVNPPKNRPRQKPCTNEIPVTNTCHSRFQQQGDINPTLTFSSLPQTAGSRANSALRCSMLSGVSWLRSMCLLISSFTHRSKARRCATGGVHLADCSPPGDLLMAIGLDALPCGLHQRPAHHTAAAVHAMKGEGVAPPACPLRQRWRGSSRIDDT